MLSGIGAADELPNMASTAKSICKPNVGKNLQDHLSVGIEYETKRGRPLRRRPEIRQTPGRHGARLRDGRWICHGDAGAVHRLSRPWRPGVQEFRRRRRGRPLSFVFDADRKTVLKVFAHIRQPTCSRCHVRLDPGQHQDSANLSRRRKGRPRWQHKPYRFGRAVGIKHSHRGQIYTAYAANEVVLCGGVINSPKS